MYYSSPKKPVLIITKPLLIMTIHWIAGITECFKILS